MTRRLRIAVIGHVEHVTLGRVPAIPQAGDITHLEAPVTIAGGGGGVAFWQLVASDAEVHLFTALGDDDAAAFVADQLAGAAATVHAARRRAAHTRDLVMIDPSGERTIAVVGQPLHPRADDPLPWDLLGELDAVYFTADDAAILARARAARLLIATARRQPAIAAAGVRLDAVVGSRSDPREVSTLADYAPPPAALIMTDGPRGGVVHTAGAAVAFAAPPTIVRGGAYGAGDSFAGAFVYHLAAGATPVAAATRAAAHGAAVLASIDPLAAQRPLPGAGARPAR
ncbi:MAG: sugar kinase [Kofleriaceae bacterium]|nr:sugar kinase [Kofleriaceae bacterium]